MGRSSSRPSLQPQTKTETETQKPPVAIKTFLRPEVQRKTIRIKPWTEQEVKKKCSRERTTNLLQQMTANNFQTRQFSAQLREASPQIRPLLEKQVEQLEKRKIRALDDWDVC